jgi:Ca-activated chloride channel family protein
MDSPQVFQLPQNCKGGELMVPQSETWSVYRRPWLHKLVSNLHGETNMPSRIRRPFWLTIPALLFAIFTWKAAVPERAEAGSTSSAPSAGSLQIMGKNGAARGECPLKHTSVRGAISGYVARVTVTQIFENTASDKIEAVYTFPLPDDSAVDDMTIQIGDRTVRGLIKKREDARAIYEHARSTGHLAALLDQERPNIFTQAVANIMPGEQVSVTISYLQVLQYEAGSYEFVFPMVVGPRYIPGQPVGQQGGGWPPDTRKVPDASRITPPVARPGTRAGHDISLELSIDAGVPIQKLHSKSHEIDLDQPAGNTATVKLRNEATIPNKDFILRYQVAGKQISDAVLSQWMPGSTKATGGYFTLILQPPAQVEQSEITPKELVFVVDTSGSMYGFPLDKAKELMDRALDELYPGDTFNLITFSGDEHILFPEPVFPTAENIRIAKEFMQGRRGSGGTEMMKAIRAALDPSDKQDHLRVVCFITDGFVGNDMEIIGEIQKHPNARVFSFGIGNSVNRFLLSGMAKAGRGDVEFVNLSDKAGKAADRLYQKLRSPLLTDIAIDWGGLPVKEVYPQRIPDLFSGKPLVLMGRYAAPANGTIHLRGKRNGEDFVRDIPVRLSANGQKAIVLPTLWARQKVDDLMSQDWVGAQQGSPRPDMKDAVTELGLDYRMMTQYTSFVAVEEQVVTKDGQPRTVQVPVEMPEGVSYEGVFGEADAPNMQMASNLSYAAKVGSGYGLSAIMPMASRAMASPPPPVARDSAARHDKVKEGKQQAGNRKALESKLHPALLEVWDCWQKTPNKCEFVQAGKVKIQIWLTTDSQTVLDRLKALGFELIVHRSGEKTVVGKLAVAQLQALSNLAEVKMAGLVKR